MDGNQMMMREALIEMRDHADKNIGVTCNVNLLAEYGWFVQKINAALSAPARQCDVGTEEERLQRWRKFCNKQNACVDCPCNKGCGIADCFDRWAQMPYEAEEGGAE